MEVSLVRQISQVKTIQTLLAICLLFACALVFAGSQEAVWRYTVRPGDNLITLGKRHLINPSDWREVQRLNHIKSPYHMPAGMVLKVPLAMVKQGPAKAEVIFVSGHVEWQQSATNFEPLKVGQVLGAGARIVTKNNSKVMIEFADETIAELTSNGIMTLDTMSLYSGGIMVDTKLRLQKGKLETHANPKHIKGNNMQVITPSAIAAVRGTKFRVTSSEKITTQETLDGQVALGALNREVLVNKGFGSKAEFGKAPVPPVALLPAANTDKLKEKHENVPLAFDMPEMQGATAWAGRVSVSAEHKHVIAEAEVLGNQLVFGDIPDGDYHLRVRAKDQHGIAGYDALHQFILNARPIQPELVFPAANEMIRSTKPTLRWEPVAEAQAYAVELATNDDFSPLYETQRVTSAEYTLEKALQPGQYFWRVVSVATNAAGQEDVGPAIQFGQFSYKPAPVKPDLSQLQVNISHNRVFVHIVPPPKGLAYYVRLDNEFNSQEVVWQGSNLQGDFDFLLKEYGKQTLHIRHVDSDGVLSPVALYEFYAQPQ